MRYENEKCPVCGEVFKPEDDVVVCPVCATPHHRSCYNELSECVNEDKHGEGFIWQKTIENAPVTEEKPVEPEEYSVCPECGTKNKKNALVCSNCASVLNEEIRQQFLPENINPIFVNGASVDKEEFIDEENIVSVKEAASFIQKNKESYISVFLDSKRFKRRPKFNFSAFIFGPYWFFFRKMYKPGFALAGVNFALSLFAMSFFFRAFESAFDFVMKNYQALSGATPDMALYNEYEIIIKNCIHTNKTSVAIMMLIGVAMFGLYIFAGFIANKTYLNFIKSSVIKIRKITPNEGAYYTYLFAKGGVSFMNPVLIAIALYYINEIILSYAIM